MADRHDHGVRHRRAAIALVDIAAVQHRDESRAESASKSGKAALADDNCPYTSPATHERERKPSAIGKARRRRSSDAAERIEESARTAKNDRRR